ncbi:MAG: hypothetical protein HKO07_01880 [Pseudomonadales bacterium]|nr:hypothetical protein [Pseudomonadales bacterium]
MTRDQPLADVSSLTKNLSRELEQNAAAVENQISTGLSKAANVEQRMDNILAQYEALSEKTTQLKALEATLNRRIAEKAQVDVGLATADLPLRDLPPKSEGLMRDQEKNLGWWLQILLAIALMVGLVYAAFQVLKRRQLDKRSAYVGQWDTDILLSPNPDLSDSDLAEMIKLKGESLAAGEQGSVNEEGMAIEEGEGSAELQASLYIAYERFNEAEELLNKALAQQPDNNALKSQLLEVYAALGKTEAYQALASQLADNEPNGGQGQLQKGA